MNFAGIHKLPLVFVCEHNNYAISVHWRKQAAVENVAIRAEGYGFPGVTIDGNDVVAVYTAMQRRSSAQGRAKARPHRGQDLSHRSPIRRRRRSRYRSREEVEQWEKKGPLIASRGCSRRTASLDDRG